MKIRIILKIILQLTTIAMNIIMIRTEHKSGDKNVQVRESVNDKTISTNMTLKRIKRGALLGLCL